MMAKRDDVREALAKVSCGVCRELRFKKTPFGTHCRCEWFGEDIVKGLRCQKCFDTLCKEKIAGTKETTLRLSKGLLAFDRRCYRTVSIGICCAEMNNHWDKEIYADYDHDKFEDCKVRYTDGNGTGKAINYCPFCGAKVEIVLE